MGLLSKYGSPSVRGRPSQDHRNRRGSGEARRVIAFPGFVRSVNPNISVGTDYGHQINIRPLPPLPDFRPSYGLATNLYVFSCNINDNIIMIKDGSSRSVYERAKHSNQWSQILFEAAYMYWSFTRYLAQNKNFLTETAQLSSPIGIPSIRNLEEFQCCLFCQRPKFHKKNWQNDTIMPQVFFR